MSSKALVIGPPNARRKARHAGPVVLMRMLKVARCVHPGTSPRADGCAIGMAMATPR